MLQFQFCSEKAAKLTRFSSVSFKIVLVSYGKLNISNNQACNLLYTSIKPWRNHSRGRLKRAGFCFGVSVFFQFLAGGSNTEWPEVTDVCWSILKTQTSPHFLQGPGTHLTEDLHGPVPWGCRREGILNQLLSLRSWFSRLRHTGTADWRKSASPLSISMWCYKHSSEHQP